MEKIIRVTGEGRGNVSPDTIEVRLGLTALDKSYSKSLEEVDKKVLKIKAEMKKLDIEDVKTENFSIHPQKRRVYGKANDYKDVFLGFETSHNLRICFDFDCKLLGDVVSSLADSLSEPRFNISFTSKKMEEAKSDALKSAVEKAKSDAEALAAAAGVKLGDILSINHSFGEVHFSYPRSANYDFAEEACLGKSAASCSESFRDMSVDDIKIQANVTIEWQIK